MARKQIDLFGNEISSEMMKKIEEGISSKAEEGLGKVLAILRSDNLLYSFVKSGAHSRLLKHIPALNDRDSKLIREIAKLLKLIYDIKKNENYVFIDNLSEDRGEVLLLETMGGLSSLYLKLKAQTNELELFRAFFEMLVFFIEEVFKRIKILLEDTLVRLRVTKLRGRQIDRVIGNYLKSVVIEYRKDPEIKVGMTCLALTRPFFEVAKFYGIDPRI